MRILLSSILILIGLASAGAACPNWNYTGQTYVYGGAQLLHPQSFSVTAGGQNALRSCGFSHIGYTTTPPDFSFVLSGMEQYSLNLGVTSQCDSVLLVNTANTTWFFDDDSNGNLDPRLSISGAQHLSGRVDVWVGSYNGQYCNATLTVQALGRGYAPAPSADPGPGSGLGNVGNFAPTPVPGAGSGYGGAQTACPTYSQAGTTYSYSGAQLYTPQYFNVTAGGTASLSRCPAIQLMNDHGPGYFSTVPAFSFNLSGMRPYRLVVAVSSACDATLLINTGAGQWFYDDDDNGNLDPRISLVQPPNGRLDVWVGTYNGGSCQGQLNLETFYR